MRLKLLSGPTTMRRQRDSLADAHLTKKRRYGTGRERATTVIERYLLLAGDKMISILQEQVRKGCRHP
jgi:hypothetical protein